VRGRREPLVAQHARKVGPPGAVRTRAALRAAALCAAVALSAAPLQSIALHVHAAVGAAGRGAVRAVPVALLAAAARRRRVQGAC